jgi:hypothetical protein
MIHCELGDGKVACGTRTPNSRAVTYAVGTFLTRMKVYKHRSLMCGRCKASARKRWPSLCECK